MSWNVIFMSHLDCITQMGRDNCNTTVQIIKSNYYIICVELWFTNVIECFIYVTLRLRHTNGS